MDTARDLTGNDYISIASVAPDGGLDGITVLHGGHNGLIEWHGESGTPLLQPIVHIDGVRVEIEAARWRRLDRWIPTFTAAAEDGSTVSGSLCAPLGYPAARGFLLKLDVEARGRAPKTVRVELVVNWHGTRLVIASPRPLPGVDRLETGRDPALLALATDQGRGPTLAVSADRDMEIETTDPTRAESPHRGRLFTEFDLAPARRQTVTFLVGAGREGDGAVAAVRALRRTNADEWLRQSRLELSHILRPAQDHRWAEMLNRNLIFNRYFAAGRTIDRDRLCLVRSRSPYCAAPAVFNEREALLWTLPALMVADPALAREAILRVLETFSERSGELSRYLDGGSFDAGVVLEQFLLYPWVIDHYVERTGDRSLLDEPLAQQIVYETDLGAFMRLHPEHLLARTELLPSGEPADFPYGTMGGVLLHALASALPRLTWTAPEPPQFADAASDIAATVWQHCATQVNGDLLLAYCADLDGHSAVYDDPALSLALAPFFGFCSTDDPVWQDTMTFLRSSAYPLWRQGELPGTAGRSDPSTALLAPLCADLLGHAPADALDRLRRLRLPAGVAAAAWDPVTGTMTGLHDAALAGFLAWSLIRAAEPAQPEKPARRRRR